MESARADAPMSRPFATWWVVQSGSDGSPPRIDRGNVEARMRAPQIPVATYRSRSTSECKRENRSQIEEWT